MAYAFANYDEEAALLAAKEALRCDEEACAWPEVIEDITVIAKSLIKLGRKSEAMIYATAGEKIMQEKITPSEYDGGRMLPLQTALMKLREMIAKL